MAGGVMSSDTRKKRSLQSPLGLPPADRQENLLEWLYALRDHQRKHVRNGAWLIKGKAVPWENNRQGRMQWYLHPALEDTAIRSMMFFRQEIPPRSRSGAQRSPGGQVIYIIQGRGYTLLDGVRHDWEEEDVVNIPIRADGVTVQHVNIDKVDPVIMICADLNLADLVGLDRGSEFEQVEDAPD
jgi:gentisate 1,2-dioxygenase